MELNVKDVRTNLIQRKQFPHAITLLMNETKWRMFEECCKQSDIDSQHLIEEFIDLFTFEFLKNKSNVPLS